jgi:hypothetical protein
VVNDANNARGPIAGFFANPVVGVIGTLASMIGVGLAIYFYWQGKEYRQLVYYVHPAKASIVKASDMSSLTVYHKDKKITADITAVQVAFWNAGRRSIQSSEILEPITLQISSGVPILEATIRKSSRDAVKLALDDSRAEKGTLGLSWRILEQNDGGVVQVVYAGSPEETISLQGTIEGQARLESLPFSGKIRSASEQCDDLRRERTLVFYVMMGIFAIAMIIAATSKFNVIISSHRALSVIMNLAVVVFLIAYLVLAGYWFLFLDSLPSGPPFGF